MSLTTPAKGVVLSVKTETFTSKQRQEQSFFRFSKSIGGREEKIDHLDPAGTTSIAAPGLVGLILIWSPAGTLSVAATINGVAHTLVAAPMLLLSGVTLGSIVITNTDAAGTSAKDVSVEWYS
jgi:hypothetical protein